jgi:hypothetical protein
VRRHDDLALVAQGLNITTFRCVPRDLQSRIGDEAVERHLDTLNRTVLDRLQRGGDAFVSNAVVPRPLRAARVHRHFPHDARRRGRGSRDRGATGTRRSCGAGGRTALTRHRT